MTAFVKQIMLMAGVSVASLMGSAIIANAAPPAIAFGELPLG